ncbi:MAG: DUF86 domain-containing protein [Planctomycetota bacterium]
MKDDRIYLDHILECMEWIFKYTVDGRDAFFGDRKTQSAILRELQTLSESAQRLSAGIRDAHPEVDWKSVIGFRNVLVHDYLGIKLDRVWEIVERDLPVLRSSIETMKRELGG